MKKSFADIYLQFLELATALREGPNGDALEPVDIQILQELVLCWRRGAPLHVREAMHLSNIASPATLHKRIKKLRDLGLITAARNDTDARSRSLVPTDLALKHFSELGSTLLKVAKGHL